MGAALLVLQAYRWFLHDGGCVEPRAEYAGLSDYQELCGKEVVDFVCVYLSFFSFPLFAEFLHDAPGLCGLRLFRTMATDTRKEMVLGSSNLVAMFFRPHLGFDFDSVCICGICSYRQGQGLGISLHHRIFGPMVQWICAE